MADLDLNDLDVPDHYHPCDGLLCAPGGMLGSLSAHTAVETIPLLEEVERLRAELARRPRVWREGDAEPDDCTRVSDRDGDAWNASPTGGLWWHIGLSYEWAELLTAYGPLVEVGGAS